MSLLAIVGGNQCWLLPHKMRQRRQTTVPTEPTTTMCGHYQRAKLYHREMTVEMLHITVFDGAIS